MEVALKTLVELREILSVCFGIGGRRKLFSISFFCSNEVIVSWMGIRLDQVV